MLIPLIALLIPVFRLFPPLYRWRVRSRIYCWYTELRDIGPRNRSDFDLEDAITRSQRIENEVAEVAAQRLMGRSFTNSGCTSNSSKGNLRSGDRGDSRGCRRSRARCPNPAERATVRAGIPGTRQESSFQRGTRYIQREIRRLPVAD